MKHRHTPDLLSREPTIPLPTLIHDAVELFKALLQVVVAEERALDGPEDTAHGSTVQIGLYAHRGQDSRTSNTRPPRELMPLLELFSNTLRRARGFVRGN